ncbi:MAG: hypothetical protein R3D29_06665 [Nitratireductor sp.]
MGGNCASPARLPAALGGNFAETGNSFLRIGDITPTGAEIDRIGSAVMDGDLSFYGNGTAVFEFRQ